MLLQQIVQQDGIECYVWENADTYWHGETNRTLPSGVILTEMQQLKPDASSRYQYTDRRHRVLRDNLTPSEAIDILLQWEWRHDHAEAVLAGMQPTNYTKPDEPWAATHRITRTK